MKKLKNIIAYFASVAAIVSLAIPLMVPIAVQAQSTTMGSASDYYCFNTNLGAGRPISSSDAQALAAMLISQGFWNAGTPITAYSDSVASAVSGFQEKYAAQILTPNGLTYGTGYVGAATRAELNTLGNCNPSSNPSQPVQSTQCPVGYTCTPINQPQAPVCPAGWTCTPITNPINPSVGVPVISSVTGSKGFSITAGNQIDVIGQNLITVRSGYIVSVSGGQQFSVTPNGNNSNTSMAVYLPANVSTGQYDLYLTDSAGTSAPFLFTITSLINPTQPTQSTGITTPGVSGTLTITESGVFASSALLNLQAGPSDMQVNTILFDFNSRPWLYYSTFSLVNETTGQVLIPPTQLTANNFIEITAGQDYRYIFSGLNFVVPHGQSVGVQLIGQTLPANSQSPGVAVISASVRAVDGTGVTQTSSTNPTSSISQIPTISQVSGSKGSNISAGNGIDVSGNNLITVNVAYIVSASNSNQKFNLIPDVNDNNSAMGAILPSNVSQGQYYLYLANPTGTSLPFPITVTTPSTTNG